MGQILCLQKSLCFSCGLPTLKGNLNVEGDVFASGLIIDTTGNTNTTANSLAVSGQSIHLRERGCTINPK